MSHQRTSGQQQVRTGRIQTFVYQEVFLFPSQVSNDFLYRRIEIAYHFECRLGHRTDGFQQRSLIVQRLTGISDEYSRDTQRIVHHKHRRRRIPRTVTAGLECISHTSVRERRTVGFLLYQQLSGKFFQHASLSVVFNKGIMLFSRSLCQRLEPVRIVSHAQLRSPFLHTRSHLIGNISVQRRTVIYHVHQFGIHLAWQILEHFLTVEYIFCKVFTGAFLRRRHIDRFLVKRFLNYSKS